MRRKQSMPVFSAMFVRNIIPVAISVMETAVSVSISCVPIQSLMVLSLGWARLRWNWVGFTFSLVTAAGGRGAAVAAFFSQPADKRMPANAASARQNLMTQGWKTRGTFSTNCSRE